MFSFCDYFWWHLLGNNYLLCSYMSIIVTNNEHKKFIYIDEAIEAMHIDRRMEMDDLTQKYGWIVFLSSMLSLLIGLVVGAWLG